MILRDFLNRLLWDEQYKLHKHEYEIIYTHRGAPKNQIKISCAELTQINSDSFEYHDNYKNELKRIPFHRIDQIIDHIKKEIVYKKAIRR